jgi:predicted DNA-binding transcriptional regulator AlpA
MVVEQRDCFVDKRIAAQITGLGERTLDKYAYLGIGPRWVKVGRLRRYRVADLYEWLNSQPTFGGVQPEPRSEAA